MVDTPTIEALRERADAQVQIYINQGFDLDAFEFLPFEEGRVFHTELTGGVDADGNNVYDLPNREQAWLRRNEAGNWDIVFLDYESAQNVYAQQAEQILEEQRETNGTPETNGELSWFPNQGGRDDRPVPDIEPFWITKNDATGEITTFRHENFQLTDANGEIIEPQDGVYPPHVFDLETGRLANGYFMAVNPDNPPDNAPSGSIDANGYIDVTQMRMYIGWKTPDPHDPDRYIRFHPAEEGFAIGYVQSNGVDPSILEPATLIGSSASFYIGEDRGVQIINMPNNTITRVEVEARAEVVTPSTPDYSRVTEAFTVEEPVTDERPVFEGQPEVAPLETYREMMRRRFANDAPEQEVTETTLTDGVEPAVSVEMPDYSGVNEAFADEEPEVADNNLTTIEPASGANHDSIIQLSNYLDANLLGPQTTRAMQALLNGEFGEPSAMDLAFVAEALYEHVSTSFNEEGHRSDLQQVIFDNLQTNIGGLREAAGYDANSLPSYSALDGAITGTIDNFDLLERTSFLNDPEFAASLEERQVYLDGLSQGIRLAEENGETYELTVEDRVMLSNPSLPEENSADYVASLDINIAVTEEYSYPEGSQQVVDTGATLSAQQYYDFANTVIAEIFPSHEGRELITASFSHEASEHFPLLPVYNDEGTGIMTLQNGGEVRTLWRDAEGETVALSTTDLGGALEQMIDMSAGAENLHLQLEQNPELEAAVMFLAMSIHEVQQIENNAVEPSIDMDAADPGATISRREEMYLTDVVRP